MDNDHQRVLQPQSDCDKERDGHISWILHREQRIGHNLSLTHMYMEAFPQRWCIYSGWSHSSSCSISYMQYKKSMTWGKYKICFEDMGICQNLQIRKNLPVNHSPNFYSRYYLEVNIKDPIRSSRALWNWKRWARQGIWKAPLPLWQHQAMLWKGASYVYTAKLPMCSQVREMECGSPSECLDIGPWSLYVIQEYQR